MDMPTGKSRSANLGHSVEIMDWQGRSGAHYALICEHLGTFVMRSEADLYIIARDDRVLWVGSALDLVADPASRTQFRRAMQQANAAFRLDAPMDRNAAIWDLDDARPAPSLAAQAA
jgi:ABC-type antimicrobial peptide transport system ATPase subunit